MIKNAVVNFNNRKGKESKIWLQLHTGFNTEKCKWMVNADAEDVAGSKSLARLCAQPLQMVTQFQRTIRLCEILPSRSANRCKHFSCRRFIRMMVRVQRTLSTVMVWYRWCCSNNSSKKMSNHLPIQGTVITVANPPVQQFGKCACANSINAFCDGTV